MGRMIGMKFSKNIVIFTVCFLVSFSAFSFAQKDDAFPLKPGQPIIVDGDKVEYFEEDGRIIAEGNVSITYGDIVLRCDKIEVNTVSRKALCEGNVRIEQPDGVLTGERIRYDFAKEEGEIIGGEVKAFPWFGRAEETGKVGENEYLLRNGYVTTCDLDVPHYRIKAAEIRIVPDKKIVAKNVFIYIGKVPVMWFPYYYHPIIELRAKVQFIPGVNSDWGYFLLSAWRFHIKGNSKVDVLVDYRTKKGFAEGADLYYNLDDFGLEGLGEGLFRAYFIHQNDKGTYDRTAFRDNNIEPELRKRFQWKHRLEFDPGTVGMLEFNKYSDEYVLKDYFYNEYEENNRTPANYVSVISAKSNYIFSVEFKRRFNDFYTVVQKLPEVKLDVPDQRLWETPFYYSQETSGTVFDRQYAFESSPSEQVERFDTFHKISYVTGIGPVNLTPYATVRETVYSRTKWSGHAVARAAFGGGLNTFARFHRIYDASTDFLGLDINKLRHIIVPSAEYFHLHQPTVDKDNLFQMDELDSLEKENGVRLSLENKFQTKRHAGKDLVTVDFARFITSVDFLFRMKKDKFEFEKTGQFRELNFDLELRPYSWLFIDSEMEVSPKNQSINTGSIEASLRPWDNFNMALGFRYEKDYPYQPSADANENTQHSEL